MTLYSFLNPASDLPFGQRDVGTRFVSAVVLMMAVLATLSLGGALILQALRTSWVDAVQGQATVEMPAKDRDGAIRAASDMDALAESMQAALLAQNGVTAAQILARDQVVEMVKPWLGAGASLDDLPLPSLIALTLKPQADMAGLQKLVVSIDGASTIDTHQDWLSDLRRFSAALLGAAALMAMAVLLCSVLTVVGAVKARLAAHRPEIDLLHVMGATDHYIARQFTGAILLHICGAAVAGVALGLAALKACGRFAGELQAAMLPELTWHGGAWLAFLAVPLAIAASSLLAARIAVLRSLHKMP